MVNQFDNNSRSKEPIAIVGIGCRFPGGIKDPISFWDFLCEGRDAIVDVPEDRWDIRRFYDSNPKRSGKMYIKQAGYLKESHTYFDPMFFGISPREAECLDPQQRLLLEVVWEAIDDGGFEIEVLKGSQTGVFIGGFCLDSMLTHFDSSNRHLINSNTSTSSAMAMLANRISYVFDFCGPSLAIDTACSSSLVACHYACQSIWNNESSVAVVGGVNTMTRPEFPIVMSKGQFLSKQCRCMTFDDRADGYIRGEGAGIVLLKPLKSALADKDRIYALIRASGINQDGHTPYLTLPNQDSQVKLLRQVYHSAGVHPNRIQYVEAHGTGTRAGDSVEAMALNTVLSQERKPHEKCFIGSVKTNIGHLEAAAGVAGLIKAALCLQHRKISANLHFKTPNSDIPFDELCIKVPTKLEDLSCPKSEPLYAGVNSFGYGGTNAHVLLEAPPEPNGIPVARDLSLGSYRLVPLSARSEDALNNLAKIYHEYLVNNEPDVDLDSLAYTLSLRRSHHPHRLVLLVQSKEELIEKLRLFSQGQFTERMSFGKGPDTRPSLVFVFTGMGPQWWGMGRVLLNSESIFREQFKRCDKLFHRISGWSMLSELLKDEHQSGLDKASIAQPLNFAIQVSLSELWKSWGVVPDAVVGHSVGEVAAAYESGVLSLEDALLITFHRSHLQQTLAGSGSMLVITGTETECQNFVKNYEHVSIAAINSPNSVTIAGTTNEIEEIAKTLSTKQVLTTRLKVDVAYHSYQMDSLDSKLRKYLENLRFNAPTLPLYSTVTGDQLQGGTMNVDYWLDNVRKPVLFEQAMASIIRDGHCHYLEIGPHPVLSSYIKECLFAAHTTGATYRSLTRNHCDRASMLESLGDIFVKGFPINWEAITPQSYHRLSLPTYPWQREHYWLESEASRQDRLGQPGHTFLNEDKFMPTPTWEVEVNTLFFPYLDHHRLNAAIVFPAAGYVEAGLAIHRHLFGDDVCLLEDIRFPNMLAYNSDIVKKIQSRFNPRDNTFSIYSKNEEDHAEWTLHASGEILPGVGMQTTKFYGNPDTLDTCSVENLYGTFEKMGLHYGDSFRAIVKLWRKDDEVLAKVRRRLPAPSDSEHDLIHPTVLDACFQTFLTPALLTSGEKEVDGIFVPFSIRQMIFFTPAGDEIWCHAKIIRRHDSEIEGDLTLFDDDNHVIAQVRGVCFKRLGNLESRNQRLFSRSIYELRWEENAEPTPDFGKVKGDWLVFDLNENWCNNLIECYPSNNVKPVRVIRGHAFRKNNRDVVTVCPNSADHMERLFKIYEKEDFNTILYLWSLDRKNSQDRTNEATNRCVPLLHLAQKLARKQRPVTIVIFTFKAQAVQAGDLLEGLSDASIWGLARVIANEHPNIHCKLVDLDSLEHEDILDFVSWEIVSTCPDNEVATRNGKRWVNRLARTNWNYNENERELVPVPRNTAVTLEMERSGDLDSFYYSEIPRRQPGSGEIEIQVHSTALNFKDLLKCYGRLPHLITKGTYIGDAVGMESSGTITRKGADVTNFDVGDQIIATFPGAFSSYAIVPTKFVMHKPEALTLEDSPVMIGFVTACYCLRELARLRQGEKILIHSASGGVGLAALQIAQHVGAEIFATAGTTEKRNYLQSKGVKYVYNSRNIAFAEQIKKESNGYGVDVVIGAVSGDVLRKSFTLLAPYGRYLEIGKKDIAENNPLPMRPFNENVSFFAVDIDRILADRPRVIQDLFQEIKRGFAKGYYHSIPVKVFSSSEIGKAFQYMATSRHIGKIVVRIKDQLVPIRKRISLNGNLQRDGTYLIAGGTSGLGLAVSRWLSEHNVRQLVLVSRNGKNSDLAQKAISAMNENGTEIYRASVDVTNEEQMGSLFNVIETTMPPLRGIFHCAGVVDDGLVVKLDKNRFESVMAPKVKGAMLLHQFTKESKLDFFVSFSSISSLIGNPGQANYAAANAFLDAFAHFGRTQGVPATTINWGIFSDQGVVARNGQLQRLFEDMGIHSFSNNELFQILEAILIKKPTQVGAFTIDWEKWATLNSHRPKSSLFSDFIDCSHNGALVNQSRLLKKLKGLDQQQQNEWVLEQLKRHIGEVLRFPADKIDVNCTIEKMGIDSLMAAELRLIVMREFGLELSTATFLQKITISQICKHILNGLGTVQIPNNATAMGTTSCSTKQSLKMPPCDRLQVSVDNQYPNCEASPKVPKVNKARYSFKNYLPYLDLRQRMADLRQQVEKCGIFNADSPYFRVYDGVTNHTTRIHGEEYINFSSYNYLGLSGHPEVSHAARQAISDYGTSVSASRMVSGERPIHQELEDELAQAVNAEAAIVFVSGHATNVTTIGHLFGTDDLIVHDSFIHDSILQGCMLSGAKRLAFPHNDTDALDSLLQKHRDGYERLLIVIEGIYSMDGDIPVLPRFIELKHRYDGLLMVDEAHSLGVLGDNGCGIGEFYQINPDDVDIWMGTLSKSLASCGGYIAGCKELVEYLRYTAPGFRYSVGISPANAAAALAAIRMLKREPERVRCLQNNAKLFSELAGEKSLGMVKNEYSPILPVVVGNSNKALQLSHHLFNRKINVQPILYPAVSEDAARLRFFVTALHTDEQIRYTINTLAQEIANL